MAGAAAPYRKFEFTRVVHRSGGAVARNGLAFIALAIVISGGATFLAGLGISRAVAAGDGSFGLWQIAAAIVSGIAQAVLQLAITRATILDLGGRPVDLRDCVMQGLRLFVPVIGLTILYFLGIMLGAFLLLFPALILVVMWSVSVPVLVEENPGVVASLGRSRALTKGARWPIFGLLCLYFVALMAVGTVQSLLTIALSGFIVTALLVNAIGTAAVAMVWSVVTATIYIELRDTQEGVGTEQLAEIFA